MNIATFPKDKYILIFRDVKLAETLAKRGHKHIYCLTDKKINSFPQLIKYYPYSLNTHFPVSFFDIVISPNLKDPVEIGRFFIESHRIITQGGKIFFQFGTETKHFKITNKTSLSLPKKVNIICNSLGKNEGISEYSKNLKCRFEEKGIEVQLCKWLSEANYSYPVIFQYEPGIVKEIPKDPKTIIETHFTNYQNMFLEEILYRVSLAYHKRSFSYIISEAKRLIKLLYEHPEYFIALLRRSNPNVNKKLQEFNLLIRHPVLAQMSQISKYTLMPHIEYPDLLFKRKRKTDSIFLGAFGFPSESKNFPSICDLAVRLNVKLLLIMSISGINSKVAATQEEYVQKITADYLKQKNIIIKSGYFSEENLLSELSVCTHIISAQNSVRGTSGSMRMAMRLRVPVISIDNFQAHECGAIIVKDLDDINKRFLESVKNKTTNLDDGFYYLLKILQE